MLCSKWRVLMCLCEISRHVGAYNCSREGCSLRSYAVSDEKKS